MMESFYYRMIPSFYNRKSRTRYKLKVSPKKQVLRLMARL